jgi:hypothetical protein
MDFATAVTTNLLSAPVLFFLLGVLAAVLKSDLKFPESIYVALTIYLLVAIGFKGGVAIANAGLAKVWWPALLALLLGALVPMWCYPLLRFVGRFSAVDAASIAAHYGSVSAVTYIAATNYLKQAGVAYEDYAAAFLAVMESPAIILGVLLGKLALRGEKAGGLGPAVRQALHEACLGRSVFLLVGAMLVGWASGERGREATAGFFVAPFQGVLTLFLLEMGLVAGRRLGDLKKVGPFLLAFGLLMPLVHGFIGAWVGVLAGLSLGGATLLAVLAASASYIAAPAAMRLSLPEANPTLSLTAALAITFPFNVTVGIPLYYALARHFFPAP